MRRSSWGLFALGSASLAASGFLTGSLALGGAAAALAILWTVLLFRRARAGALTAVFLLFTALALLGVLAGGPRYLPPVAVGLGLAGWESALAWHDVAPFTPAARRRFAHRHLLQLVALAGVSALLSILALHVHLRLTFHAALSAGLLSLLLFGLALRIARGAHRGRRGTRKALLRTPVPSQTQWPTKKNGRPPRSPALP